MRNVIMRVTYPQWWRGKTTGLIQSIEGVANEKPA